ncbi:hypothetical protein, partial [Endobacter medicaginis]
SHDKAEQASTLRQLVDGGLMSRSTARRQLAGTYDVDDDHAEADAISADEAASIARADTMPAVQTKAAADVES